MSEPMMMQDPVRGTVVVRRGREEIHISPENAVYARDLIRNFDYYFGAVQSDGVVDYSKPALHTMRDGTEFWFPQLAEPQATTDLYLALMPEGCRTVLDLGAYAGAATWAFSKAVGLEGRVLAFEPDPQSYACLERNVRRHGLTNVMPYRKGIWSHSGRVEFQAEGNMGSAVVEARARTSPHVVSVSVTTLDDLALEQVDFIKMDIEGSELEVVRSSRDFLQRHKPVMVVEPHRVGTTRTDTAVTEMLREYGATVKPLDQCGLVLPLLHVTWGQ